MDERTLVALCKNGDRNALQSLYESYAAWMMGISMRYVGDAERSRDILHDSFVNIFGSVDGFEYRGVGSLKAWLGRITVNTALASLQKRHGFLSADEVGDVTDTQDADGTDREPCVEGDDDTALFEAVSDGTIIRLVGGLPVRLRVVFNLFIFEDVPHGEIARRLDISESASKVRLHRARALLADALREYIKTAER